MVSKGLTLLWRKEEEIDAHACNPGDTPSPDSVSSVESCENKVMDVELSCGDTSAVSIGKYFFFMISFSLDWGSYFYLIKKLVTSNFFSFYY